MIRKTKPLATFLALSAILTAEPALAEKFESSGKGEAASKKEDAADRKRDAQSRKQLEAKRASEDAGKSSDRGDKDRKDEDSKGSAKSKSDKAKDRDDKDRGNEKSDGKDGKDDRDRREREARERREDGDKDRGKEKADGKDGKDDRDRREREARERREEGDKDGDRKGGDHKDGDHKDGREDGGSKPDGGKDGTSASPDDGDHGGGGSSEAETPDGGAPGPSGPASPLQMGATLCTLGDIGPGASACGGFYLGNLNGGGPDMNVATAEALNTLLGVTTFTSTSFTVLADLGGGELPGGWVDFAPKLYGQTLVSFHVGGANGASGGVGYNGTAFYLFDAGTDGLDSFAFNRPGLSNARLFQTGSAPPPTSLPPLCEGESCGQGGFGGLTPVPEPGTWALMILGFGAMGAMLRRRRALAA